ncbi:MAG: FkbM family methyltransferase [Pyrinomonadaceae bacterium]
MANKIRGLKEVWTFDNRLWLAVTKIFFRKEQLHVYRYKGAEILIDHAGGDSNGAREVLSSPMYKRFLPLMKLDGPANVLDLGANNGGFPVLLLTSGIPLKKVVSLEFNPQTFVRLHFNLMRNLACESIAVNAALCGEERVIETTLGKGSVSDSIYARNDDADARPITVAGRTFDDLANTYFGDDVIDICKIDVEGAEFEVFLGPHHASIARCRYLIMEIHERDGRRADEIVPIIERLGLKRRSTEAGADPSVHFFINSELA